MKRASIPQKTRVFFVDGSKPKRLLLIIELTSKLVPQITISTFRGFLDNELLADYVVHFLAVFLNFILVFEGE